LTQLQNVEQKLLAHDPNFTSQHTHASITSQRSALLSAFRPIYPEGDYAGPLTYHVVPRPTNCDIGASRIHLNVERWRACEPWFWPGMAGVDSAGLGEVLQNVLARFPDREKGWLAKVCEMASQCRALDSIGIAERVCHRFTLKTSWAPF
jgi:actin-related protein 5